MDLMTTPEAWLALLLGYAFGAIPFGLLLTQAAGLGDIRDIGSGNIGATNVLRTGNKKLAAATLLCDLLKGTAAVLLTHQLLGAPFGLIAGLGAFLGHIAPVWLAFRGGKGVATFLGVLLGLWWPMALTFVVVWLAVAFISRYSSLSALVASMVVFVAVTMTQPALTIIITALMTLLLIAKHHANIQRLLAGQESKIGGGKS